MHENKSIIKQQWFKYLLATIGFFIAAKTYNHYQQNQNNGRTLMADDSPRKTATETTLPGDEVITFTEPLEDEKEELTQKELQEKDVWLWKCNDTAKRKDCKIWMDHKQDFVAVDQDMEELSYILACVVGWINVYSATYIADEDQKYRVERMYGKESFKYSSDLLNSWMKQNGHCKMEIKGDNVIEKSRDGTTESVTIIGLPQEVNSVQKLMAWIARQVKDKARRFAKKLPQLLKSSPSAVQKAVAEVKSKVPKQVRDKVRRFVQGSSPLLSTGWIEERKAWIKQDALRKKD